jgi:CRP-like cAMP-binding protein
MDQNITLELIINFLLETPMFEELNAGELSQIVHIMQMQRFREGQPIFSEGDHGDAWYVLFDGKARVTKSTPFGPEREVATLEAHACFGEMAILDGSARSATVSSIGECTLFRFPRLPFLQLMEEGNLGAFKLVHGMARVLCQRQRYLTTQLSELMEELEELEDDAKPALTRDLGDLLDRYTLSE